MKRVAAIFSVMLLLACQREIPVRFDAAENRPILQGELKTSDERHTLFLSIGTPNGLQDPGDDARVTCYVNGEKVAVSVRDGYAVFEEKVVQKHLLAASFHPGDRVRFEASAGGRTVSAETVVPPLPHMEVDSSSVRSFPESTPREMGNIAQYEARTYEFRLTLRDLPGQENFYKTLAPRIYITDNPVAGDASPGTDDVPVPLLGSTMLKTDDPVYANVTSPIPSDVEATTGLSLGGANTHLIFNDRLFPNGEKTFVLLPLSQMSYASQAEYNGRVKPLRSTIVIEAASLSEAAFRYYNSVNVYLGAGPFNEPVPLQSNVEGGYGFVHIMATAQHRFRLKDLHPGTFGYDWTDLYRLSSGNPAGQ